MTERAFIDASLEPDHLGLEEAEKSREISVPSTLKELIYATIDANAFAEQSLALRTADDEMRGTIAYEEWLDVTVDLESAFFDDQHGILGTQLLTYATCGDAELRNADTQKMIRDILGGTALFAERIAPLIEQLCAVNPRMERAAILERLFVGEITESAQVGVVHVAQRRRTLMGVLAQLSGRLETIAEEEGVDPMPPEYTLWNFDRTPERPTEVILCDPFGSDASTQAYWVRTIKETKKTLFATSGDRTGYVVNELELFRQKALSERDEKLERAVDTLEEWLERNMILYESGNITDVENYDLLAEGAEGLRDIVTALDLLKHQHPDFFIALMGIAPRGMHSPYFGSFVHKALFNTQRLVDVPRRDAMNTFLRTTMHELRTVNGAVHGWDFRTTVSKAALFAQAQAIVLKVKKVETPTEQTTLLAGLTIPLIQQSLHAEVARQIEEMRSVNLAQIKSQLFVQFDRFYGNAMFTLYRVVQLPDAAFLDRDIVARLTEVFGAELLFDPHAFHEACVKQEPNVVRRVFHDAIRRMEEAQEKGEHVSYNPFAVAIEDSLERKEDRSFLRRKSTRKDFAFFLNIIYGLQYSDSLSGVTLEKDKFFLAEFFAIFPAFNTEHQSEEDYIKTYHALCKYKNQPEFQGIVDPALIYIRNELMEQGVHIEMRELFGKYYLGCNETEYAFTVQTLWHSAMQLTLDHEARAEAMNELKRKLVEPDVIRFLELLKRDPAEKEKWMLVYVPERTMDNGKEISILSITHAFTGSGERPSFRDRANDYSIAQPPSGWFFVSKDILQGTLNEVHEEQEQLLITEAERLGFLDGAWSQMNQTLRFFSLFVNFKNNNERLMQEVSDRSLDLTDPGKFVIVGSFNTRGIVVTSADGGAFPDVGVSLYR